MSWLQRLGETYDACFGQPQFRDAPLTPISALPQETQLHVRIRPNGTFLSASIAPLKNTTMFVTEASASRSGTAPQPNPLVEQLEYCAAGVQHFGGDSRKFTRFQSLLQQWVDSGLADSKVEAVCEYVKNGTLLDDLLKGKVLVSKRSQLIRVDTGKKTKTDPLKLWIRWSVSGNLHADTWSDLNLAKRWAEFENRQSNEQDVCMVTGQHGRTTQKHPKYIRRPGDNAKLISANDKDSFTFRGRFVSSEEALTISYAASQKAHNALRWLISKQKVYGDGQVVIAWEKHGVPVPTIMTGTRHFLSEARQNLPQRKLSAEYHGDAGRSYDARLARATKGYKAELGRQAHILVIVLDSVTDGRMAIRFYREIAGSELLDRIEHWHKAFAWPQVSEMRKRFIGAPAPIDIAKAAYGRRDADKRDPNRKVWVVDAKISDATVERLLPCIIDARPVPMDLVTSAIRRATNRAAFERDPQTAVSWDFEHFLGIACSLLVGSRPDEEYKMSLEPHRRTRSYLFGRLLAIGEKVESYALFLADERRDTAAERLMQRFAAHPAETWETIRVGLVPYMRRIGSLRPHKLLLLKDLLDNVSMLFETKDFISAEPLDPEFLLGYHCQRAALRVLFKKKVRESSNR